MEKGPDELIPTRATLLVRLKDWQDQSSWQDFFTIYRNLIFGVARKAGLSQSEADEVVQETMIAVAKQMPDFEYNQSGGSFKTWLLNLTRWRIMDQIRKRLPHETSHVPTDAIPDTVTDASAQAHAETGHPVRALDVMAQDVSQSLDVWWHAEWQVKLLEAAVAKVKRQLEPQKYQIFDFYVNKEWPPEKVATTFGINISQVYLAKHRVTEMIAKEVQELEQHAGFLRQAELETEKSVNSAPRV